MIVKELFARLVIKIDDASVKKADSALSKIKSAAIIAGEAFAALKITGFMKNLANDVAATGDHIAKTSKQLGINAQALQELSHAATLAGASQEEFIISMRLLQKASLEAAQGGKTYEEDFKRLGVSVKDSSGELKSAEILFEEMSSGFQNLTSATERTGLAQSLLGGSGTKLIPVMMQGAEAIRAQRMEARKLGIFSDDMLEKSEKLVDANARLNRAWLGAKILIASAIIPRIEKLTKRIAFAIVKMRKFAEGTSIVETALIALTIISNALAFAVAVKLISALGGAATAAISAAGGTFLLGAAFLALLAIVFLIGEEIITALQGGDTLGRRVSDWAGDLYDKLMKLESSNKVLNTMLSILKGIVASLRFIKDFSFAQVQWLFGGGAGGFKTAVEGLEGSPLEGTTGRLLIVKELFEKRGIIGALSDIANSIPAEVGFGEHGTIAKTGGVAITRTTATSTARITRNLSVGDINITTQQGQSPAEIGDHVIDIIDKRIDDKFSQAENQLVPAVSGVR